MQEQPEDYQMQTDSESEIDAIDEVLAYFEPPYHHAYFTTSYYYDEDKK